MSEAAIEISNLSKSYGLRPVLRNVSLEVRPGEVYALVGPNGAGKTTLIRLVCGLAFPSSGAVRLLGQNPLQKPAIRRKLGAVVEAPAAFYPYLSGRANLELQARLAGGVPPRRVGEVLGLMELTAFAERKLRVYSLGMRQRLGVAAAMLTEPEVLVLDEPASGMDPLSLQLVHRALRQAAELGAAVLLSTHHLDEVVAYCSTVGIMEEGALIDEIGLRERRDRYRASVSDPGLAQAALKAQPFIQNVRAQGDDLLFVLKDGAAIGRVAGVLLGAGLTLYSLQQDSFDLRSYYADKLRRGAPDALEYEDVLLG